MMKSVNSLKDQPISLTQQNDRKRGEEKKGLKNAKFIFKHI